MKVVCNRKGLLEGVNLVNGVVPSRTTKEILSSIKMIAENDKVTLVGFDTEIGVRWQSRGNETERTGAAIIPVGKLGDILKNSAGDKITLDTKDDVTKVSIGRSKYELPTRNVDEFPDVPTFDNDGSYHTVTAGDLRTMLKRVAFAVDKKDSGGRFALKGVSWKVEGSTAKLAATDTRRLAVADCPATVHGTPPGEAYSFLLPPKCVQILGNILVDDAELVSVSLRPNDAMFQTARAMVYTTLVNGRFPPYKEIIGQQRRGTTTKTNIPVQEFLSCIRQASITTDIESQRVDFVFGGGEVTMKARGADSGSSEVIMSLPEYTGPETPISFDPIYITEFLRAMDGEETVLLEMSGGDKPVLFRCGDNYSYLVQNMVN